MKTLYTTTTLLICSLTLSACDKTSNSQKTVEEDRNKSSFPISVTPKEVLATVNGRPIGRSALEGPRGMPAPPPDEKRVDELISREVVRQYAEKQHLTHDPVYAEKLDNLLRQALSQMAVEDYMKKNPVTDEAIKAEYEQKFAAQKAGEFKARHILVDSEDAAKGIIAELQKGARFDELAKKQSKDPGSKDKGGDLGWFDAKKMEAPFAAAVETLRNGETSATPVQTKFGWHVILREDSRQKEPPALESVKNQLRMTLQAQKFQQFVEDLKKTAKVERKPLPPIPGRPGMPPAAAGSMSPGAPGEIHPLSPGQAMAPVPPATPRH